MLWWAWGALAVLLVDVGFGDEFAEGWGRVVGIILLGAGIAVTLRAFSAFSKAETTFDAHTPGSATTLITTGVYRLSRNPMYLGMMMLLLGWGLWRGSIIAALIGSAVFVALVTRLQVIPEERALAEKFGDEYAAFTSATRRWI